MKLATIGFLGKNGGKSKDLVDLAIIVPSDDAQRIKKDILLSVISFFKKLNRKCLVKLNEIF